MQPVQLNLFTNMYEKLFKKEIKKEKQVEEEPTWSSRYIENIKIKCAEKK